MPNRSWFFLLAALLVCITPLSALTSKDVCAEVQTKYGKALAAVSESWPCMQGTGMTLNPKLDVRIELDVTPVQGPKDHGSGLIFGMYEDGFSKYYTLLVTPDGYYKLMYYGGTFESLIDWSLDPDLKQGYFQTNHIAVEVHGQTILCYVNGKYAGGYQSQYRMGGGLGEYVDVYGAQTVFGDLTASTITWSDDKPVPGRNIVVDDMISQRNLPEIALGTCSARYVASGYEVTNIAQRGFCKILLQEAGKLTDQFRIELNVTILAGPVGAAAGFTFAQTDPTDDNTFSMYGPNAQTELQLSRRDHGKWSLLLPWSNGKWLIRTGFGSTNTLVIEARGRTMHCYINGYPAEDVLSAVDLAGVVSLYLDQPGMQAVFSHLRVTQL